jgi:tripartite-type tricarboxylate transporter receptor subunit TctC
MILPKSTPQEVQQWYHDNFIPAIRSAEAQKKFDENLMFITRKEHTPAGVHAAMARLKSDWTPIARRIKPE